MATIIISKIPDGGYMMAETGTAQAGFAETQGAATIADVQRKLEARGITLKAMRMIPRGPCCQGRSGYSVIL